VTDISDRQEVRACKFAVDSAAPPQRRLYARACHSGARIEKAAEFAVNAALTYENPVYGTSFPDPGPLSNTSTDYYAYSTGNGFPILKSTDLVNWEYVGKAFRSRPRWVVPTGDWHPWAPSVLRSARSCPGTTSPGCYFMYYGGLSGQHVPATDCVAVAWSLTPSGPFTNLGPIQASDGKKDATGRPPGCGDDAGYGNIDASPFVDGDAKVYLYLSTSRRCAQPTPGTCPYAPVLSTLPLAANLVRTRAARKPLVVATANSWEQQSGYAPQVENPWMEKRGSTYYLFYSGGYYGASYGMGYATASNPTGGTAYAAFTKSPRNPILRETSAVLSPGGGSVTRGPQGGSWLVYHGRAGGYTEPRTLRIDPLLWGSDGSVSTTGPTTGPQTPAP
jgi:beta-xylosidase